MENVEIKEIAGKAAIKRLKELIKDANICMFSTSAFQWSLQKNAVDRQTIDEQGNIWIIIDENNAESNILISDPQVQLFYSNAEKSEFLSVFGNVTIHDIEDAMNNNMGNLWLKKDANNPQFKIVKITPEEAHYWDVKINDMVPLNLSRSNENIQQKLCA